MQIYKELINEDNDKSTLKNNVDIDSMVKSLIEVDKTITKKFIYEDNGNFVSTDI